MKRILIAVLSLTIIVGALPTAFAEDKYTQTQEAPVSDAGLKAARVLSELGFLWDSYNPTAGMTRKELAEVCVKLLGIDVATAGEAYFPDVALNMPCADYVYAAVNNGVLDFMKDSEFAPDSKVTYNELLRAVETVLGYNMLTDCSSWSNLYSYAVSKGLSDGVSLRNGAAVKSEYAAIVVYNGLDAARVVAASFGKEPEYKLSTDDTILDYHRITKGRGIVTATPLTALGGENPVGDGEIAVDNIVYKADDDCANLIGRNVEYYVKDEDSDYTVLYAAEHKNSTLEIKADDIADASARSIKYEKGTTEKTVNLPSDIEVIYNRQCIFDYTSDMLRPGNGSVTLIDNDYDGEYDVVITEEYRNYIVDDIRKSTYSVTDMDTGDVLLLDADKYDHYSLEKNGKAADFDDIKRYNVISAYESDGYIKAVISDAAVPAALVSVDSEEGCIVTDGGEYKYSAEFDISTLRIGEELTLLTDFCGLVAGVNRSGFGTRRAGVLINVKDDLEADETIVKIFTEDNAWVNFTAADKVKLNGEYVEREALVNADALYADGTVGGVAVLYKLNSGGELKILETAVKSNNDVDALRLTSEKKYRRFTNYTNSFMPESKYMDLFVDQDTLVFRVPSDAKNKYNAEKYQVASMNVFSTNSYYTVSAYNATDTVPADIVLYYADDEGGDIDSKSSLCIVNRVYRGINSYGDVVNMAEIYRDSVKSEIWSDDDTRFDGLKRGNVIRYSTDVNGNVTYVDKYFDIDKPPLMKQGTQNASGIVNIASDFCTVYGRCTDKNSGYITLALDNNPSDLPKSMVYPVSGAKVYCYDTMDNRITVVSVDDIETGDMLFMRTQISVAKDILIIR